jgi:hypothetical protein
MIADASLPRYRRGMREPWERPHRSAADEARFLRWAKRANRKASRALARRGAGVMLGAMIVVIGTRAKFAKSARGVEQACCYAKNQFSIARKNQVPEATSRNASTCDRW